MNMITAYYHITCDILKDHIPFKPQLKLSNAKKYCGQIDLKKKVIYISKWNHIDNKFLMDEEDKDDIIDTICHELAHIYFLEHNKDHEELTKLYKTVVINQLKIKTLESLLSI